jgi:hypothetical protein
VGLAALLALAMASAGAEPLAAAEPPAGDTALAAAAAAPEPLASDAAVAERVASVRAAKAGIAAAATALLLLGAWLRRRGRPDALRTLRDAALAALGVGGLLASWNFLSFHYTGVVHAHELFNYAVGSRYFPELGYDRLYECVAVADTEAGLGRRVAQRRITDLSSYALRGTREILADPSRCKRHFSPVRWRAFARDVGFFRGLFTPQRWEDLQRDHGFNATPAWAALGRLVAAPLPLSKAGLLALASLDVVLDLAAWGLVAAAFGWRATCVALVYWGTNQPAGYEWTGGAFLRHDWLAAMLVALACLRRARPLAAGALFGAAALLRAFPLVLLAGPLLGAAAESLRARRLGVPRETLRMAAGALLAAAVLLPLAAASVGAGAWPRFARNIAHHASVPASNTMGLRTALSYTEEGRLAKLLASHPDPGEAWKERRRAAFEERRLVFWGVTAAYVALLAAACAGQPAWVAAVLGTGLVPFVLDGACYYTAFLAAWGLLWLRREAVGIGLCALATLQWAIAARFPEPDDAFAASSVAMLAFVAVATALFAAPRGKLAP